MRLKNKQIAAAGWLLCVLMTQSFAAPVRSAAEPDYPPLSVVSSDGKADGFSVELLRAALAEMGMEVSFQTGLWSEIKTGLAEGQLDVLPLVGRTPERKALFDFTVPYLTMHGAIFVRNDNTKIKGLGDLQGQRIAVMKGDNAEEYVRSARLSEVIIPTQTFSEAFQMLSDGRADAVIAQKLMGVSLLKQMGLSNIQVTGKSTEKFKQDFCFAVKKGNARLLAALNEGLSIVITKGTLRQLEHKWLYPAEDVVRNRTLVFSDDYAFPPYSFLDEKGRPTGFNVELLRAVARQTGMTVSFNLAPWNEVRDRMQAGAIDITCMFYPNPERESWVDFSTPHSVSYRAVFARNGSPPYKTPADLKGRRIAVQKGDSSYEYALQQGLGESLTTTETLEDALALLEKGQVDFALGYLSPGLYWVYKNGWTKLHAVDPHLQKTEYCYVVQKDDTALLDQLNDGLMQLRESGEYRKIYDKWLGVLEHKGASSLNKEDVIRKRVLVFSDDFASPPYSFLDENGRPTGFNVELLRAVARKVGLTISFKLVPWGEVLGEMQSGDADISCMHYPNPEKEAWVDFSVPHSISYRAVFARRDSPPYKTPADLKGRRISAQVGGALAASAKQLGGVPTPAETLEGALDLLEKRQADFALCRLLPGRYWIHKNGWGNLYAVDPRLQKSDYCYVVRKGDTALLDLLNDGLEQVKGSGEYRKLYNHWLGVLETGFNRQTIIKILLAVFAAVTLLTVVIGLIIFTLRQQVKKRTVEFEVANQSLKESRQAALNLMEDAVLAKERLELTQFALDHSGDSAFWADSTGRLVYANEAACRNLGYDQEELLRLSVPDIDPDMPRERWLSHWPQIKKKKSLRLESHHKTKDGRVFPVELHISYVKYGDKEHIFTFAHDITSRKEAEKHLRFERSLFLSFMEALPANVYFKDTNGRFVYVNQFAADTTGMKKEDLIGKTDFDLFPENQARKKFEDEQRVMNTRSPIQIEEQSGDVWHMTTKAPRYDENGNIAGTFGISWDITDRVMAQQKLEESRQFLRTVIDSIPTRVFWKDRNATFLGCNLPLAHDVGLASPEEVIGKTDFDLIATKEQCEAFRNDDLAVIESGTSKLDFEEPQTQPDGSLHWLKTNKVPLKNVHGEIIGVIGAYEDITERKRKEVELRDAQELFRLFMRHSPVHTYIKEVTPTESRVLQASDNFQQMTGIPDSEMVGKTMTELFPPELALKIMADDWAVVSKGEVLKINEELNGRNYETIKFPIVQGDRTLLAGYTMDITERKRMQEAIEKRIIALTRPLNEPGGITFSDLFDLEEIQRVQDEFAAATGVASIVTWPDGTPITRPSNFTHLCRDIIRKTEKGCSNCFKSDATLGRHHPEGPIVETCLSGGLWDAGVSITVGDRHIANWLIGQVRDKTQTEEKMRAYAHEIGADEEAFIEAFRKVPAMPRKHFEQIARALFTLANQLSTSAYQNIQQARFIAEEKKNQAEMLRLSTAIEQSPEAVMIAGSDGILQYVNPAFEVITGYSREEALGKNPKFLKSGHHDKPFYSNLWKTVTSGKTWEGRFINKRKNGDLYTEEASISPVRDPSGAITGYVAVKRDITEELIQEEKFRQSQKMEAIGQLSGGIAHDFNNILQAILGFSELLLKQLKKDSLEHQNALEVQKAAQRAAEMTRQLLAFSRKQPVDRKRTNLNAAIRDTEVLLQLLLGDQIKLIFEPNPALHEIYADHGQLTQIIMNLAINARDAMPAGGHLTVTTENITFAPQDIAGKPEAEPGAFVCLSFTDTGCGMSRETKDHLFEPFFTTKPVGQGTGLGLAVVYGIVKQNKGWIDVHSEEGRGANLKIYLPICGTSATSNPTDRTRNKRILLVEDDAGMRNMLIQILESAGYEPVAAASAKEALELFEQQKGDFNLLFSDIVMPGKDGIELADALREKKPGLPVLLYSGYQDQHERWVLLGSKGYHFLKKPDSVDGLLTAVYSALSEVIL